MIGQAKPARRRRVIAGAAIGDLRRSIGTARTDDVFLYAAALAFYGLISVAPLGVVALWVTALVVGEAQVQQVGDDLAGLAPPALGVDKALERAAEMGTTYGLVAVVAALWPATAYGSALVRVLDRVAGDRKATGLRGRGAALLLVCLVPVLVLGSLLAGYAGTIVLGHSTVETGIGLAVGLGLSFAAAIATVAFIYKVFPRTPPGWPAIFRGASVAAAGISMLSVAYAAYLRLGVNFDQRYASDALAAVVLLGLWLFAANAVLVAGYRVARQQPVRNGSGGP